MLINDLLEQKGISIYKLSKNSGIPYTTVSDICTGKAQLEKCSSETVYRIAKELDVSMETLLEPYLFKRSSFELFKSNVCHQLKELGDIDFIIETLEQDNIRKYYKRNWFPECFYLLAMLDYISRLNDVPLCTAYNDLRHCKLQEPIYPASILTASKVSINSNIKAFALKEAIPEFARFNIIEAEVRNVI